MVCRKSASKAELFRFVVQDGCLVWDKRHSLAGRGAYLHARLDCWTKMCAAKSWAWALRLEGRKFDAKNLERLMDEIKPLVVG